jgi:hypothetical protein
MTDRLIVRRGYYYIGDIKNGHGNLNFQVGQSSIKHMILS